MSADSAVSNLSVDAGAALLVLSCSKSDSPVVDVTRACTFGPRASSSSALSSSSSARGESVAEIARSIGVIAGDGATGVT